MMSTRFAVAFAFLVTIACALDADEPKRTNIVIIYADDMGYGDLNIQNPDSRIPTENLDQLARDGLRFTDGHSSSGICTPSRYALLTGRHHWRDFHGIVGPMGRSVFAPERLTLPEMLGKSGYKTACIGKWHLGWDWDAIRSADAKPIDEGKKNVFGPAAYNWDLPIPDGPLAHGFDYYFGDTVINFPPYCWIENDRVLRAPDTMMNIKSWKPIKEGNWECRPGPMVSDWDPYDNLPTLTRHAVEYIKAQQDSAEPFFLYFALPCPHAPIIPNDSFDGRSSAGPFGDFVVEMDDACGQILTALKECGLTDNTVVVFTADNGPEKYAYARDAKFDHWSAAPFRGLKRDIYEGGHHVPFIIRWPGLTRSGLASEALVSQIDLMATFAEFLKFDLPDDAAEDSHSLMPLLTGESEQVRSTHIHNTNAKRYAIRHDQWLLVDGQDGYHSGRNKDWEKRHGYLPDDDQEVELYDLKNDVQQMQNLARQQPELVAELRQLMKTIREQGHSAPRLKN